MKQFFILAGANGSGKSTISKVLLPNEGVPYINPDDIAKRLNPSNPARAQVAAGKETLMRVAAYLEEGKSFAIESTLSGVGYVKLLKRAKSLGYDIMIAYIFVDSPEACIARINSRVKRGGHFIPAADVRRRYQRSRDNFVKLYAALADHWMLYYNGGMDIALVAHGNGSTNVISKERYDAFMEGICQN